MLELEYNITDFFREEVDAVWESLRQADYHGSAQGTLHREDESVVFKGSDWGALLYYMQEDGRNAGPKLILSPLIT